MPPGMWRSASGDGGGELTSAGDPAALPHYIQHIHSEIARLRGLGLSDATDQRLRGLTARLQAATSQLAKGQETAAQAIVAAVATEVSKTRAAVFGTDLPESAARPAYEPATGVYIRLIALHMIDRRAQYAAFASVMMAVEEFRSTTTSVVKTQVSGAALCMVVSDEHAAMPPTEQAFLLGLHVQLALTEAHHPAVVIIVRDDDFQLIEGVGLDRAGVVGRPFADADAIAAAASQAAFVLTPMAFLAMRNAIDLRPGLDLSATSLVTFHKTRLKGMRTPSGSAGEALVYDCEQFQPLNYRTEPRPYSLHLRDQHTGMTVLGSAPGSRQRLHFEYRAAGEDLDGELFAGMLDANVVEVVGFTNEHLAELIDQAWMVR